MKKTIKIITSVLLLFIIGGSIFAYGENGGGMIKGKGFGKNQGGQVYQVYDNTQLDHKMQIDIYPVEELSQKEIDGLMLMREEEKLARDVYLELYDIWGQQIFSNIGRSEDTHTNAIKSLLNKYELEDPMTNDIRGVFENQDLQNLYDSLVEQGSRSLLDALKVGATIEDLDIYDLQDLNKVSDNQDITAVYNNLEKGSRNHLRSFTKMIERNGGTYEAQYITEEYYNEIIGSDMERSMQYNAKDSFDQINNQKVNEQSQGSQSSRIEDSLEGRNQNNPNSFYETTNQEQSQNMFVRMWRDFKSWFN